MAAAASLPLRHFRSLDAPGDPTAPPGAREDPLRAMAAAAPGTAGLGTAAQTGAAAATSGGAGRRTHTSNTISGVLGGDTTALTSWRHGQRVRGCHHCQEATSKAARDDTNRASSSRTIRNGTAGTSNHGSSAAISSTTKRAPSAVISAGHQWCHQKWHQQAPESCPQCNCTSATSRALGSARPVPTPRRHTDRPRVGTKCLYCRAALPGRALTSAAAAAPGPGAAGAPPARGSAPAPPAPPANGSAPPAGQRLRDTERQ